MDNKIDINFTNLKVIDGNIYGLGPASLQKLGLPANYKKEHKILRREVIQCVETKHAIYYGHLDLTQMPQIGKFITIVGMFGNEVKINIDMITEVYDVQAVLVRYDIVGYDNIWEEIKDKQWAYMYKWMHFKKTDNVQIANEGDTYNSNMRREETEKRTFLSIIDYPGKGKI